MNQIEIAGIQHYRPKTETHQFVNVTLNIPHHHQITIPAMLPSDQQHLTVLDCAEIALDYLQHLTKDSELLPLLDTGPDRLYLLLVAAWGFASAVFGNYSIAPTPWDLITCKPKPIIKEKP